MKGFLYVVALFLAFTPFAVQAKLQPVAMRPPAMVQQAAPADVVRGFYMALTGAMKGGDKLGFSGRYNALQASFNKAFNVQEMTRVAVGPSWVKTAPEQQDKLVTAFRHFSLSNYAAQFKSFGGEVFDVIGEKKGMRDGEVIVETTLISGHDKNQLNYLMRKNDKGWQIVDVFVNGAISEMATRRSEFGAVVRTGGVDGLLDVLGQKSKALADS